VLDDPTPDLDIATLELVEQVLVGWSGTLLLVSHDRTFLDHVVTSLLVFEGRGHVQEYTGGYEDWVRQRAVPAAAVAGAVEAMRTPEANGTRRAQRPVSAKLTYREQRGLGALPARIEALEIEQRGLFDRSAHEDFYKETESAINATLARIAEVGAEIDSLYERWGTLDARTR
jgi:ATP-binding cassette subfamily F protein uup